MITKREKDAEAAGTSRQKYEYVVTGAGMNGEEVIFASLREARDYELANSVAPIRDNDAGNADSDIMFDRLLDVFLEEKRIRVRWSTYLGYEVIIRRFIRPAFSEMKARDIKPADVRAWQNRLMQLDYEPQYIRKIDCTLGTVFNYGMKLFELPSNPALMAGSIGSWKTEKVNFWTLEEYRCFIATIADDRLHLAFELLYWTGMRVGELLALTPGDYLADERAISINKTFHRFHRRDIITEPKTKKSKRIVYLHNALNTELSEYLRTNDEDRDRRIFPFTADMLHGALKRGTKTSGVHRIKIHDLRHSHASLLIEMNVTPLLISERLGHEKVETTLNIYSHLYPNKQQQLADRLETAANSIASGGHAGAAPLLSKTEVIK